MRLIKFFTYNQFLLENLINHTLYFSNVEAFNDPFEGIFRYRVASDPKEFNIFYAEYFQGAPDKQEYYFHNRSEFEKLLNRTFEWRVSNNAVCCFSHKSLLQDVKMWSHYADKHKGICLLYDSELLGLEPREKIQDATIIANPNGPYKVEYSDQYLNEDPLSQELTQQSFLTTKSRNWNDEKEYRYISPKSNPFKM